MPQLTETCLRSNETGHRQFDRLVRDQQGIYPGLGSLGALRALSVPIQSEAVSRVLGGVLQIGGTALGSWLTHLSEATSRGMRVVGRPPNAAIGAGPGSFGLSVPL